MLSFMSQYGSGNLCESFLFQLNFISDDKILRAFIVAQTAQHRKIVKKMPMEFCPFSMRIFSFYLGKTLLKKTRETAMASAQGIFALV